MLAQADCARIGADTPGAGKVLARRRRRTRNAESAARRRRFPSSRGAVHRWSTRSPGLPAPARLHRTRARRAGARPRPAAPADRGDLAPPIRSTTRTPRSRCTATRSLPQPPSTASRRSSGSETPTRPRSAAVGPDEPAAPPPAEQTQSSADDTAIRSDQLRARPAAGPATRIDHDPAADRDRAARLPRRGSTTSTTSTTTSADPLGAADQARPADRRRRRRRRARAGDRVHRARRLGRPAGARCRAGVAGGRQQARSDGPAPPSRRARRRPAHRRLDAQRRPGRRQARRRRGPGRSSSTQKGAVGGLPGQPACFGGDPVEGPARPAAEHPAGAEQQRQEAAERAAAGRRVRHARRRRRRRTRWRRGPSAAARRPGTYIDSGAGRHRPRRPVARRRSSRSPTATPPSSAQRDAQPDRPGAEHRRRRQPAAAVGVDQVAVADALAAVIAAVRTRRRQLRRRRQVRVGPPPLGGDAARLPGDRRPAAGRRARRHPGRPHPIELPDRRTSSARLRERRLGRRVAAPRSRSARIYLLRTAARASSGSTRSCLTLEDEKAATELAEKIKTNWSDCKERELTATVAKPDEGERRSARRTPRSPARPPPWSRRPTQRDRQVPGRHRAGRHRRSSSPSPTPQDNFDFTDAQWNTIAVRAGRAGHPGPVT